jgi:hypothetical protein
MAIDSRCRAAKGSFMPINPSRAPPAQVQLSLSVIASDPAVARKEDLAGRQLSSVRLNDRDSTLLLVALTARVQFWRNALENAEAGDDLELYGAAAAYHADYERLLRTLTCGQLP